MNEQDELTLADCDIIITALRREMITLSSVEFNHFVDFRLRRANEVEDVCEKVCKLREALKAGSDD